MAGSAALRASWLGRIMAQARLRNLQCPLVWTTAASFDGVLEDKLRDLVTLAPSTWDAVVRDLVRVARMMHTSAGSLDDIKAILARCYALARRPRGIRRGTAAGGERTPTTAPHDLCPILACYRGALQHVLDATFLMVACIFDRKNLEELPAAAHVSKYEDMDAVGRAAVWAIRAQAKLTCFLGASASMDGPASGRQSTAFADAVLAASRARDLHPAEGQWKALYGDLLPDDNPRKLTLLRNAVRARRTPFTLTCLSRYLYKLGDPQAFALCADALLEWPRSVHANVSYVLMFLSSATPGSLSRCLAEQCLLRLRRLAPACVFVQGLALELRLDAADEEIRRGAQQAAQDAADAGRCLGAGDAATASLRASRALPFEPTDPEVVAKAMELYCVRRGRGQHAGQDEGVAGQGQGQGPWSMVARREAGHVQLDKCNCVCSGGCAYLTFQAHGSLGAGDQPLACYTE